MKNWLPIVLLFGNTVMAQPKVDHGLFTDILREYVDERGFVDYSGLSQKRETLDQYLAQLKQRHPDDSWTKEERLAYWINAYNAFTLELIIEKYPINSIKDIGSWMQIPFVNTPWDIKFIEIEDETYDLNNIEHDILRKEFEEPRIHFAIVCASYSCPRLRREAFTAENLQNQLEQAAVDFINDKSKNDIDEVAPSVSKIFSWFKGDFTKRSDLRAFINQYSITKISTEADISYLDYDWSLNDQNNLN